MSALSEQVSLKDRSAVGPTTPGAPGEAMRRHPMFLVAPAAVLAVLAGILGLHASTTYTATAQLVVQPLAPTVSQLPGAVQAAQDQATNESRLVESSGVTVPLAQAFHTTPTSIASHISATPIPGSTVISLDAQASSARTAVALANAAAAAFSHYVNEELQSTAASDAVLNRYEKAAASLTRARDLKVALEAARTSPAGLVRATAAVAAAQVRADALGSEYQSAILALATAPAVKSFSSATNASSNRASRFELYVLGGLIVGLLLGAAAAITWANRPPSAGTSAH
jgi:capsular polysaccharide biosynthesis protein